jgi:hypothetical protein
VMVTGGIRRRAVAEQVVASGVAMAGIATALAVNPQLPHEWREGRDSQPRLWPITWKNKVLASLGYMAMVKFQLRQLSRGRLPQPNVSPLRALLLERWLSARRTRQYRRWMAAR